MVALSGCGPTPEPKHPEQDGSRALEAALSTYGGLKTYADTGVVLTTHWSENGPRVHAKLISFKTAFVRPGSFRFIYSDASSSDDATYGFVLSSPEGAWMRSDGDASIESSESGEAAVGALTGVTQGAVGTVWALLARRNPWQCRGDDPRSVVAIGREKIAGNECLTLRVERLGCGPIDVSVDENTHLVRKVVERGHLPGTSARENLERLLKIAPPELHETLRRNAERKASPFYYETTIYFGPRVDQNVPAEEFQKPQPQPRTPAP
jgi:hypothetical protein